MFSPFSDTIANVIWNEYLETTDEYVIQAGALVVCRPPNSQNFLRKLSPSLMSKIMWHFISWQPIGRSSFLSPRTSNADVTFFISCELAPH